MVADDSGRLVEAYSYDVYGLQAIYSDILGSCLDSVMQSPMVLTKTFSKMYNPSYGVYNLGFDTLPTGGTGADGTIASIGGAQTAPPGPGSCDMPDAFTPTAPHANGQPPVLIATGTLALDQQTMNVGSGMYTVEVSAGASLWRMDGLAADAAVTGDSLTIHDTLGRRK